MTFSAIFPVPGRVRGVQASMKSAQGDFDKPIVTEIREAEEFYVAEPLHQNYYFLNKNKNPYCRAVITPKLKKLELRE